MVAMYNMGVSDHVVRLLAKRFSDGNYHVVRFWRNGANSSLQVDDFPAVNTQPTGRKLFCLMTWFKNDGCSTSSFGIGGRLLMLVVVLVLVVLVVDY